MKLIKPTVTDIAGNGEDESFVISNGIVAIPEQTWEQLLSRRESINSMIEYLEAEAKVISEEFLFRLDQEKISGKVVGNWSISKATRISFDLPLKEAQALGATKEIVDQSALKKLHISGAKINGMKKTEYAMVREVTKKDNHE